MLTQIPIVGLFLGGSNEGLIGVTYEIVGTPGAPVLRVNPISAMAPGVLRKIFEFNTGKQYNPIELQDRTDVSKYGLRIAGLEAAWMPRVAIARTAAAALSETRSLNAEIALQ